MGALIRQDGLWLLQPVLPFLILFGVTRLWFWVERREFQRIVDAPPWPLTSYTVAQWVRGHYMADLTGGPAMLVLIGCLGLCEPALALTSWIGTLINPVAYWHWAAAPERYALPTVTAWGMIYGLVVARLFAMARRWREARVRQSGLLEAWALYPYRARPHLAGIWLGRVRLDGETVITLVSESTGPPPVTKRARRWVSVRVDPSWKWGEPVPCDPPVPITWIGAPSMTPFVMRWIATGTASAGSSVRASQEPL
jgi:hypothetical protein